MNVPASETVLSVGRVRGDGAVRLRVNFTVLRHLRLRVTATLPPAMARGVAEALVRHAEAAEARR